MAPPKPLEKLHVSSQLSDSSNLLLTASATYSITSRHIAYVVCHMSYTGYTLIRYGMQYQNTHPWANVLVPRMSGIFGTAKIQNQAIWREVIE